MKSIRGFHPASGTIEPVGGLWVALKSIFFALLVLLLVKIGLLIYFCVVFDKMLRYDKRYLDLINLPAEETITLAKISLGFTIVIIILVTIQLITGAFGIVRLKTSFLFAFQVSLLINMFLNIVHFFLSGPFKLYVSLLILTQLGVITLTSQIIRMIRAVN